MTATAEADAQRGRDRELRDRLLFDAGVGAWRFDPDTDLYTFDAELLQNYQDSAPVVPRAMVEAITHPADLLIEAPLRERITTEGGRGEMELRMRAPGFRGWKHIRVMLRSGRQMPSGRYEMYGLTLDVTGTAAARNEARDKAEQLEVATRAARGGVFAVDMRRGVATCSPEFVAIVGREIVLAEVEDGVWPVAHPDDVDAMREMDSHWGEPGYESLDIRTTARAGHPWIRIHCDMVRDDAGEPVRVVGLVLDIDHLKRQELALVEARREALAATQAKSEFLASASHEIRTPLNGVVGVLHLLKREALSAGGASLLGEALSCAEMLGQLINDILDFSRIEAGKLELSPAPTEVAPLVTGVLELMRPQAEAKGLALRAKIDPALGWVEIDPIRLRQCLFNLIGNAVKFTPEGGVTVRVARGEAGRLTVAVVDTGVGIAAEAQGRLFQRFEQADVAKQFSGTGLGLAITLALARAMGGEVTLQSAEGQGSVFTLSVVAPPVAGQADAGETGEVASLDGLRVLVVDDNATNRMIATRILAALGAEAQAAEDGLAAVRLAALTPFDAILMDVNMPGIDGIEAMQRIRALGGAAAATPVVALTADVMADQRARYLAAGMDGVVAKPFSPTVLLATLADVIARKAATNLDRAVA